MDRFIRQWKKDVARANGHTSDNNSSEDESSDGLDGFIVPDDEVGDSDSSSDESDDSESDENGSDEEKRANAVSSSRSIHRHSGSQQPARKQQKLSNLSDIGRRTNGTAHRQQPQASSMTQQESAKKHFCEQQMKRRARGMHIESSNGAVRSSAAAASVIASRSTMRLSMTSAAVEPSALICRRNNAKRKRRHLPLDDSGDEEKDAAAMNGNSAVAPSTVAGTDAVMANEQKEFVDLIEDDSDDADDDDDVPPRAQRQRQRPPPVRSQSLTQMTISRSSTGALSTPSLRTSTTSPRGGGSDGDPEVDDPIEIESDNDDQANLEATERKSKKQPIANDRGCNVIGLLSAVRENRLPFASQQRSRLAHRRRVQRQELIEEGAQSAVILGDARREDSIAAAAVSTSISPVLPAQSSSFPWHSSSSFRSCYSLYNELFRHSRSNLLWKRMQLARGWSLIGNPAMASNGTNGTFHQTGLHSTMETLSYVSCLDFDTSTASLLAASSNNGILNLYDFDVVWLEGRAHERRARHIRLESRRSEQAERQERDRLGRNSIGDGRANSRLGLPSSSSARCSHTFIPPIFSMDLSGGFRGNGEGDGPGYGGGGLTTLRQIDRQGWNPYNPNEIALTSQRSNQLFMSENDSAAETCCPASMRKPICRT